MRITLVAILVLSVAASASRACTCPGYTPEEAFATADVVFSGVVLEVLLLPPEPGWGVMKRATFQVFDCWKGSPGSNAYVWTDPLGEACGVPFVFHEEYLVYAQNFGSHGYETNVCLRTQPWPPDPADLEFLGEPGSCSPVSVQSAVRVTTWGRVKALYR